MTPLLSESEVQAQLNPLQGEGWTLVGQKLQCTRQFKDFVEAIAFVNRLVEPAETAGHHPDIKISYNKVILSLTTHDAGGLTEKDFSLAQALSEME